MDVLEGVAIGLGTIVFLGVVFGVPIYFLMTPGYEKMGKSSATEIYHDEEIYYPIRISIGFTLLFLFGLGMCVIGAWVAPAVDEAVGRLTFGLLFVVSIVLMWLPQSRSFHVTFTDKGIVVRTRPLFNPHDARLLSYENIARYVLTKEAVFVFPAGQDDRAKIVGDVIGVASEALQTATVRLYSKDLPKIVEILQRKTGKSPKREE